jgi:hypothetical protein
METGIHLSRQVLVLAADHLRTQRPALADRIRPPS